MIYGSSSGLGELLLPFVSGADNGMATFGGDKHHRLSIQTLPIYTDVFNQSILCGHHGDAVVSCNTPVMLSAGCVVNRRPGNTTPSGGANRKVPAYI